MSASSRDVTVSFAVKGLEQDLHVLSFSGKEQISQLFRFTIVVASDATKEIDFSKVVGKPAVLTLQNNQGKRFFHGMVARFLQQETARRFIVYEAVLVPQAWRLDHTSDCRIFQKQHIKKIISDELLKKADIDHKFRTKGNVDPVKREYCVQYRESDWAFISRLLEEEGFFYYFDHQQDRHVLQIGNDFHMHPDIPGDDKINFHPPTSTPDHEHIFRLHYSEEVRSGAVTLNEFNFEKPSLNFRANKKGELDTDLEVYDYPGLYRDPDRGEDVTELRLEELQVPRKVAEGQSDCIRFCAGYAFTLDSYSRRALNDKKHLLVQVTHLGEKHPDLEAGAVGDRVRYSNSFQCILRDVPYRPPRVTPRPRVVGCQTAIVTGPSNEEVHTDQHGRVKVQFHWDRLGKKDENSSCWIRVSQLWAGKSWGAMWIPRIGQEVIVEFLEGNPDRPIITGRVYHAQNPPPYMLPKDKTKSTIKSDSSKGGGGFNEIRFEDKKGSEEIYTHAQKDQNEVVRNNMSTSVGGSQTRTITKDRTLTIKKGDDKLTVVEGSRTTTVKKDAKLTVQQGSRDVDVTDGNYDLKVHGGNVLGTADEAVDMWGKKGASITGDQEGITLTGTGKGVKIHGTGDKGVLLDGTPNVELKGSAKISSNAPTVTIDGTAIKLKGSAVSIKGSASVIIEGGVVKIN